MSASKAAKMLLMRILPVKHLKGIELIPGSLIFFLMVVMATAAWGNVNALFHDSSPDNTNNRVSVSLVPAVAGLADVDRQTDIFWLGVDMDIREGWHVYWRNPGDSGLPTTIRWDEHGFLTPGKIHWPRPARFDEDGITTYGYSDRVVLLVPVSVSPEKHNASERSTESNAADNDREYALSAHINWLVCKDICLPESTQLTLDVDDNGGFSGYSETAAGIIAESQKLVPESVSGWQAEAELESGRFTITLVPGSEKALFPDSDDIYFYPHEQGIIEHTAPQIVAAYGDRMKLEVEASRYLRTTPGTITGVLSSGKSGKSWVQDRSIPAIEITMPVISGADPE